MMNGGFEDDTGGTMESSDRLKGMRVSELIMEDLQSERFELIERDDIRYGKGTNTTPSSVQKRVLSDVVVPSEEVRTVPDRPTVTKVLFP